MLTILLCILLFMSIISLSVCANTEDTGLCLVFFISGVCLTSIIVGTPIIPFIQDKWTEFPLWFVGYVLLGIP